MTHFGNGPGAAIRSGCTALALFLLVTGHILATGSLPSAISDQEFQRLMTNFSEPGGSFHSDNLVSNESHLSEMIHAMGPQDRGGVYVGVGPEQNFSYIARLQPGVAFIVDIRSENRDLQLMYKALFEISDDRADFVSRLFSRPRPPGVPADAAVEDIFGEFASVAPNHALLLATLGAVRERLRNHHHLLLSRDQGQWIEHALTAFYADGPAINYWRTPAAADAITPGTREVRDRLFSYAGLMTAREGESGERGSYLATRERFEWVKAMEAKNLIVPVVGDFAGDTALKAVGRYVIDHDSTISLFYGSNVFDVLTPEQRGGFCRNLSALKAATNPRSLYIGGEVGDVIHNAFEGFALFSTAVKNCAG
jgi:hypothetical protein